MRIAKYTQFWILDEVTGYYRFHGANSVRDRMLGLYSIRQMRKLQMARWDKEPHIVALYEQWLENHYSGSAHWAHREKQDYKEAAEYYRQAIPYVHGTKKKGKLLLKFLVAKYAPFVFWIWDKLHKY